MHRTNRLAAIVAAGLIAVTVSGCGPNASPSIPATPSASESTTPSPTIPEAAPSTAAPEPSAPGAQTALAALDTLEVKGRAPRTGYDRDLFGPAWTDIDRNGCDQRNDVLAASMTDVTFKPGTNNCVVLTATLADPYSGKTIHFQRGQDTSSAVQIDHVVALSDAWAKGAQQMTVEQRTAFANDPLNLLAADGPLNMQKRDGDAATWLPPNTGFRCAYVARQIAVKATYGLWVTQAEHDAMARILGTCPNEPLPTSDIPPAVDAAPAPAPAPAPVPAPAPAPAPAAPDGAVSYANCAAVRAAGAAPIHAGDPGYSRSLDRDGDGIGCE